MPEATAGVRSRVPALAATGRQNEEFEILADAYDRSGRNVRELRIYKKPRFSEPQTPELEFHELFGRPSISRERD